MFFELQLQFSLTSIFSNKTLSSKSRLKRVLPCLPNYLLSFVLLHYSSLERLHTKSKFDT